MSEKAELMSGLTNCHIELCDSCLHDFFLQFKLAVERNGDTVFHFETPVSLRAILREHFEGLELPESELQNLIDAKEKASRYYIAESWIEYWRDFGIPEWLKENGEVNPNDRPD